MTPAARTQAAIELLDRIIAAAREGGAAADTLIARYFAERRYAGSKDRRAVRALVYAAIRAFGAPPVSGRAALVALALIGDATPRFGWHDEFDWFGPDLFDGSPHGPEPLQLDEPRAVLHPLSGWASIQVLDALGDDREAALAMLDRAPLDIRVNRLKATRDEVAAAIGECSPLPRVPDALRLPSGANIEAMPVWRDGAIEVQDEGSQIVTMAARALPGQRIIDLCAGAGGKTLALAAAMANEGAILACDVDRTRLSRLQPRAERAGVIIAEPRLLDPKRETEALADWQGKADCVLVDAPCSGTGTWRRNPEARWRLTPDRLARYVKTQAQVLKIAAPLVAPGGALVYIVCSLLDEEGAGQIDAFLAGHPGWQADPLTLPAGRPRGAGMRLTPAHDGTDGFFVARLRAPC